MKHLNRVLVPDKKPKEMMIKIYFSKILLFLIVINLGCSEKTEINHSPDLKLVIEGGPVLTAADFQFYDCAAHILYFNNWQNELSEFIDQEFYFEFEGERIWEGIMRSTYAPRTELEQSALIDPGDHRRYYITLGSNFTYFNQDRLIKAFGQIGLLYAGLKVEISHLEFQPNQIVMNFTIHNQDDEPILVMDIDKMGPLLFHYFTPGLELANPDGSIVFVANTPVQIPHPWDGWSNQWLSKLNGGEKKSFYISYPHDEKIPVGDYTAHFLFPGLGFQVSPIELLQKDGRIWLGDVSVQHLIKINKSKFIQVS